MIPLLGDLIGIRTPTVSTKLGNGTGHGVTAVVGQVARPFICKDESKAVSLTDIEDAARVEWGTETEGKSLAHRAPSGSISSSGESETWD